MILDFGKHKGKDIEDVPSSYLRWMCENLDSSKADLIEAAEEELIYRELFPGEQP